VPAAVSRLPRRSPSRALKIELSEIPGQIAAYWNELEHGSPRQARRERLEWSIREREKRLAEVKARLAAMRRSGNETE
jgi:hypothetical protein